MKWVFRCTRLLLVSTLGLSTARADIVRLNDGTSVQGVVKRNGDGYDVTDASGKLKHIPAESVQGIELTAKTGAVGESESRLASLRRSVESTSDFKAILERYTRFIELNKDTPVGKEAEKDLAVWHDRIDRGMVKVGSRWVTTEERAALQEKGLVAADEARQLLKQGRMRDADPVLAKALEEDPGNVSALYLRGWLLYNQDQLQLSRKSFESTLAVLKDHAPTLNNLAVVVWRLNAQPLALNLYDQAMLAAPLNRDVLDNVAEALNALPVNQRNSPLAQKAARRFNEQDTTLQQQMAQIGWYRWGSTWVDRTQLGQLKTAEAEMQKKLDAMNADFEGTRKKIGNIDDDIDDNLRRMKSIESTSYARDAQGNLVRLPLPSRYFDYESDNKKLARDRIELVNKLEGLRAEAKKVQQQLPTPRFKGVQRLIGLEGTPVLPPTRAAAVQPIEPGARPAPPTVPPVSPQPGPSPTPPAPNAPRAPIPGSLISK